jgi:small subunit ribosomal protein S18
MFCAQKIEWIDYKDVNTLRRFLSERGKIRTRENTGTCKHHQRELAVAIKTARELALLPYAVSVPVGDRPGGRGGRGGPRGERGSRTDGNAATAGSTSVGGNGNGQVGIDIGEAPAGSGQGGEGEGQARTAPAAEG